MLVYHLETGDNDAPNEYHKPISVVTKQQLTKDVLTGMPFILHS